MKKIYICRNRSTLVESEMKLEESFVFDLGSLKIFTKDGEEIRVLHEKGKELRSPKAKKVLNRTGNASYSEALAVDPSQVVEAEQYAQSVHPGIEYEKDGRVKFNSKSARKAWLEHNKMFNKDGGYSQ